MVENLLKIIKDEEKISRRKFINLFGKGIAGLGIFTTMFNSLNIILNTYIFNKPAYAQTKQQKQQAITMEEINMYMAMSTVEEILEGTGVKKAEYIEDEGRTNLHELLDKDEHEFKPGLVLFYISNDPNDKVLDYVNHDSDDNSSVKRDAIIFRKLIEKYCDKINFIAYKADYRLKNDDFDGMFKAENLFESSDYGCPSIVMFSYFDLLNKETPDFHDGRLKQIDILRGGPEEDRYIKPKLINASKWWVDQNLLFVPNEDGDGKIYRHFNNYNIREAGIIEALKR